MAKKHRAGGNYTQTGKEARRHTLPGPIYHNEGRGLARGGAVQKSRPHGMSEPIYRNEGRGLARGGSVKGGAGSGLGRLRHSRAAAKVPAKTES